MTIGFLFWLLYVVAVALGLWTNWPRTAPYDYRPLGHGIIVWILLFLLGWAVFGFVVRDGGPAYRADGVIIHR